MDQQDHAIAAHAELIAGLLAGVLADDRPRQALAPGHLIRRQHDVAVVQEALPLGGQRQLPEHILSQQQLGVEEEIAPKAGVVRLRPGGVGNVPAHAGDGTGPEFHRQVVEQHGSRPGMADADFKAIVKVKAAAWRGTDDPLVARQDDQRESRRKLIASVFQYGTLRPRHGSSPLSCAILTHYISTWRVLQAFQRPSADICDHFCTVSDVFFIAIQC